MTSITRRILALEEKARRLPKKSKWGRVLDPKRLNYTERLYLVWLLEKMGPLTPAEGLTEIELEDFCQLAGLGTGLLERSDIRLRGEFQDFGRDGQQSSPDQFVDHPSPGKVST